jgi:hypothetical protein
LKNKKKEKNSIDLNNPKFIGQTKLQQIDKSKMKKEKIHKSKMEKL